MAAELDHFIDLVAVVKQYLAAQEKMPYDTLRVIKGIQKSAEIKQAVDL